MSGYLNPDGSALAGGLLPSGAGQALQLDSLGNLKIAASAGASASNPLITQDQIRAFLAGGQSFSYTTGKLTSPAGTPTLGFQLFNPANSPKNLLIYSIVLIYNGQALHQLDLTSADASSITGWTNNAVVGLNNLAGSANAAAGTCGYSNAALSGAPVGTIREVTATQNAQPIEVLTNGECIWLPANAPSLHGIALYVQSTGANGWGVTVQTLEF